MKTSLRIATLAAACSCAASGMWAVRAQTARGLGTESGFGIFQQRCLGCHGNREASEKAADPSTLRQLSPEAIYAALTDGVMKVEGQSLSDEERRRVAESVSGRLLGTTTGGDASTMPNRCTSSPRMGDC